MIRLQAGLLVVALMPFLVGCGKKMGEVHGKIVFQGKPVPVGSVTFAPQGDPIEPGRPATGTPNASGEFKLSTYAKDDGALVGPHLVTYLCTQPSGASDPAKAAEDMRLYRIYGKCKLPAGHTMEVKPGVNNVVLELTQEK